VIIGAVAMGLIEEWAPTPGSVVSWHPSPAAIAKAQLAPISAVPASYMQAQHLRGFCEQAARGLDYSRLVIATWTLAGRCDTRAMSYVINAHLRRHDTYRSWFEYKDADHIVRRTIPDRSDIEFIPIDHGEMTAAELRRHIVSTPDPLHWDCFRFGVIQATDCFTVYVSVDHLNMDATFVAVAHMEFYLMYASLVGGGAPIALPEAGRYDDFCVREHQYLSTLTSESPLVRAWTEFAENNNGSFPDFPLPLGDPSVPCTAGMVTETLMNEHQMIRFESACVEAGARFVGGVLACAALAEHELTGSDTYYGLTPRDTRSAPADFTTAGWFTGLIPITVPIAPAFGDTARAAQASFDSGTDIANVPFYRVLELAPRLTWPRPNYPVVNYFDAGVPPLSAFFTAKLDATNVGVYTDDRYSYQMSIFVVRVEKETTVMVMFPNNEIARASVGRYVDAMKSVCARVAEGRAAVPPRSAAQGGIALGTIKC
jgi:mycolipenoyl-CoA---2-(long-chain-fatty acyl)-trehalose mycolipenoyltransferase / long-chain-acyl-CoA---trehalose acyltransferase